MKHMNQKECGFYNSLLLDYHNNKNESEISILFDSLPYNDLKDRSDLLFLLEHVYPDNFSKIISNSDILLKGNFSSYIGKYEKYFWLITEDGEITFLGTEISQVPLILCGDLFEYYSTSNLDELEFLLDNKSCSVAEFEYILERYIVLCKEHGFSFSLDEPLYSQKDFEDFTSIMEKYK